MPSEQGGFAQNDAICIVACAVFGNLNSLTSIKQYKDCTKKQRSELSRFIITNIENDSLQVDLRSVVVRREAAAMMGKEIFSTILGVDKSSLASIKEISINGMTLTINRAYMYAAYAFALAILSSHLARVIKYTDSRRGTFILDNLPGDSPSDGYSPGMEWIRMITDKTPMLKLMWLESWVHCNKMDMGYSYATVNPNTGYAVADWMAQGLHASINNITYRNNIKRNSEIRRKEVASVFFAFLEKYVRATGSDGSDVIFDLPEVIGLGDNDNVQFIKNKIEEIQAEIKWEPLVHSHEL